MVVSMRIAVTFVACAPIWGSTFLAIRFGNEATPPVWAATIRLAIASALLFGIAAAFRMPLPRGQALRGAAWWGLFNLGVSLSLLYIGETTVPSGISAVLFATVPFTTALLAAGFRVEPLVTRKLIAAVVAIGGVAIIFAGELGVSVPFTGLLTVFGAASAAARRRHRGRGDAGAGRSAHRPHRRTALPRRRSRITTISSRPTLGLTSALPAERNMPLPS